MHAQAEIVQLCKRTAFVLHFKEGVYFGKKLPLLPEALNRFSTQHSVDAARNQYTVNRSLVCVFNFLNQNAAAVQNKIYLGKSAEMHIEILSYGSNLSY